ncbi:peptidoglycan-binding protein [Ancylothrix sp. C2]|uniref:peptidoglycan-binding domain-containing protein n=1 Tax=Ancylothrix sp. D3o TaxID=2953691 RepID=UPI0021BAC5EF|nr:peptidoglycan-binding protein [Ancylothrix sp. D3o]MCT7950006.1 peptidoglycan-binding protein [Ancylothrix sp. D3o]
MESLACVHLALAYEAPAPTLRFKAWNIFKFFKKLQPKAVSLKPLLALLSLSIAASIITYAGSALAALQRGDSGTQVTRLQENLRDIGYYDGPLTEFFGSLTEAAIIRFQQDKGLNADGVVGQQTLDEINRLLGNTPTASFNTSSTNRTLKRGDSGKDVEELQKLLQEAGLYDAAITGFYGPKTEAGVLRYQQERGLRATGEADSTTIAQLQGSNPPITPPTTESISDNPFPRTLQQGDTGADVAELQRLLKQLNYYTASISGQFDSRTEAALIRFQRDRGIERDGIFGTSSQRELLTAINSFPDRKDDQFGQSPYSVADLQTRLKNKNLYRGAIDNNFGPETKQAVQNAQERYGVSSSDIRTRP